MFSRMTAALQALRPRAITQMRKSLADSRTDLRHLSEAVDALNQSVIALNQTLQQQRTEIERIRTRESQLRVIAKRNIEFADRERALEAVLNDPSVEGYIRDRIEHAKLRHDPFPHAVVDKVLPDDVYDALIAGLPPAELFADKPPNKQQLQVPLDLAPNYSRRVWNFLSDVVVRNVFAPAVVEKFKAPLCEWIRQSFSSPTDDPLTSMQLVSSDGRILLRTRGYHIHPHRDPKWGFITCILYLARPGDDQRWGTDLYEVDEDEEARGAAPHWIDESRCRQVSTVDFRRNRMFVFLNSAGAHGARIPEDAEPPTLERYIYQFRVGPDADSMKALMGSLPPEQRVYWEGKQKSY